MAARIDNKEFNRIKRLLRKNNYTKVMEKTGRSYPVIKAVERAYNWVDYRTPNQIVLKTSWLDRLRQRVGF